jgi:prophage antirepressor-like protein
MKDLQVFENPEFGSLTVVEKDGEPWFVAKEVSDILGYNQTSDMTKRLDDDEKTSQPWKLDGSNYQTNKTVINESGFYNAVIGSKRSEAKKFKKWVTSEVLPSIRKNGMYATDDFVEMALSDPDHMISILNKFKHERQKRIKAEAKLIESKPKVEYYEKVLDTDNTYTVTQLAKENEMTACQLNIVLNKCGVQFKQSGQWLLYKDYQDKGLTKTRTHVVKRSDGREETRHSTTWTEKGREFVRELLEDI